MATLTISLLFASGLAVMASLLIARLRTGPLPEQGRTGAVDGLRGVVAVAVLAHHFALSVANDRLGLGWHPWAPVLESLGAGGVGLFFMTTGYVFQPRIAAGLAQDWSAILVGRVLRLYPLAVVSVLLCAALALVVGGRIVAPVGALDWLGFWRQGALFGYEEAWRLNAGVLWSLWFEVAFYLALLPLAAASNALTRRRLPRWAMPALLLAAGALGRQLAPQILSFGVTQLFAAGMLAYEASRAPEVAAALRRPATGLAAGLGLALAATLYDGPYDPVPLAFYGVFFACVGSGNGLGLLDRASAQRLGEVSFGIYLLHGLVLALFFVVAAPLVRAVPLACLPLALPGLAAVTVAAAALSWRYVEAPAIRLGKRFAGGGTPALA